MLPRLSRQVMSRIGAAWITFLFAAAPALAQAPSTQPSRNTQASRDELMILAADAERQAASAGAEEMRQQKLLEATELRERLRDGDFQVGDRIVLSVRGDSALTDTFVVRAGRTLSLPNV